MYFCYSPIISGEGNGTPLQYSCLENLMDGGAWKAAVHGVVEGRTRLSDFTHFIISLNWEGFPGCSVVKKLPVKNETQVWPLGWEDPLEKEMVTHSSILAWEIPWMEEPGGLYIVHGVAKSWTWCSNWTTHNINRIYKIKQIVWKQTQRYRRTK